ncbi:hypothetical protein FKM82_000116 [Ascaphus truei]
MGSNGKGASSTFLFTSSIGQPTVVISIQMSNGAAGVPALKGLHRPNVKAMGKKIACWCLEELNVGHYQIFLRESQGWVPQNTCKQQYSPSPF